MLNVVNLPVGGRLRFFWKHWQSIGASKQVVRWLRDGYMLPFRLNHRGLPVTPPLQRHPPSNLVTSYSDPVKQAQLDKMLHELLEKQAIREVPLSTPVHFSRVFLVPKNNVKMRMVIDLSLLNQWLDCPTFQLDHAQVIREALAPGMWATSIDLSDAYLHIPIHPLFWQFLVFQVGNKRYQFMVLPLAKRQSFVVLIATALLTTTGAMILSNVNGVNAQSSDANYTVDIKPEWNDKGELLQPTGFRGNWVYLGSPLTPNAMNGGAAGFPEYHNVYVQPSAFNAYRETGKWPEGTIMLKELQLVDQQGGDEEDGSRYEVSGRGFFPGPANGMDVAVKDSSRFADTNNWGYFNFGHHAPPYAKTAMAAPKDACAQCHIDNAGDDMVFEKFYEPILTPLPLPQ